MGNVLFERKIMRKFLVVAVLFLMAQLSYGQEMERDFFGDLIYKSVRNGYSASLKKDVFDAYVFTDNHQNKLTYGKKYLRLEYEGGIQGDEEERMFFWELIRQYGREHDYQATFQVDVFDRVVIEDNRDYKLTEGKDIFGNQVREETINGDRVKISEGMDGSLSYSANDLEASLKKNIFDQWVYSDSKGNQLEFSPESWHSLNARFGDNKQLFGFITNMLLFEQDLPRRRPSRGGRR